MIWLAILLVYIIIVVIIKFNPIIYIKEEGTFLQYTIKGKFGEKETVIKKYYSKWEVKKY